MSGWSFTKRHRFTVKGLFNSKAGKQTGVTNTEFIKFTLSEGTYSIDDFNAKIKISILQQRQGWESPQINDLNLLIPKDYLFMADNAIFYSWYTRQIS